MGRHHHVCHVCSEPNPGYIPELTKAALRVRELDKLNDGRCLKCICEALRVVAKFRAELELCQYCAGELAEGCCVECGTKFQPTGS